jgi:hypothetical protein
MTGLRSLRSMKRGSTPTPCFSELRLFSREAISLKSPQGRQMSVISRCYANNHRDEAGLANRKRVLNGSHVGLVHEFGCLCSAYMQRPKAKMRHTNSSPKIKIQMA